jgi:GNAT superfamily N-acetyltransferase
MSGFEVVRCRPEFREQVIALRRHSYETEFAEVREYLEWKYERNPWIKDPILYLALDAQGRVAGMRGAYGTCWRTPAGPVVIPCADDFAIAREHRNSGLMTAIMRFALDDLAGRGFEYVMNTSGGRVTVLQSLAMGWKSVGALEPVARLGWRQRAHLALRERTRGRRVLWRLGHVSRAQFTSDPKCFARLDRRRGNPVTAGGWSIAVEAAPRPDAMADLAARLPDDGRIRHVRDGAFFAWRFDNPMHEYRLLFAERDGRLEGWLAIARNPSYRAPMLPFYLSDWVGTSEAVRAELLRRALSWGGFEGLGVWTGTMRAEDRALLEGAGFRPVLPDLRARGMPCVLLKKLSPGGEWSIGGTPALDRSRWDVRLLDSMHG